MNDQFTLFLCLTIIYLLATILLNTLFSAPEA